MVTSFKPYTQYWTMPIIPLSRGQYQAAHQVHKNIKNFGSLDLPLDNEVSFVYDRYIDTKGESVRSLHTVV